MKRFIYAVYRVVIPAAFVVVLLCTAAGVISTFIGQQSERTVYNERQATYSHLATPIAATAAAIDGDAYDRFGGIAVVMGGAVEVSQLFATNTPRPGASFATNTPAGNQPVPTETPQPEATPLTEQLPAATATFAPLPTILYLQEPQTSGNAPTAVPTAFPIIDRKGQNLLNILLLGQDNEVTGDNLARTDTMIIVSINRDTNTVSMLSLPRDLYVYMPGISANGGMNRLNVAYGVGNALGWDGGPFFYMRQVILHNLGINVHYYALIDLSGFAELIDTIGGIDISVDCAIQDYQIFGAKVPEGAILSDAEALQYTLPIGFYHMSGEEALWYARSRGNSDDFDRGRRQQAIIRAAFRAVIAQGLLTDVTQLPQLISGGLDAVETDLRAEDILGLIPNALQVDPSSIESFRLIRTYHTTPWQPPDGQFVQLPQPGPLLDLMNDFYTPPTSSQVALRASRIRILNGTENNQWDRVAADRLGEVALLAYAGGRYEATSEQATWLIDYTGSERGSLTPEIIKTLRINPANVRVEPNPNRDVDYEVIVGADFNPCGGAVLPPQ